MHLRRPVQQRHAREYAYAAAFLCGYVIDVLAWICQQTGPSVRITWQVCDVASCLGSCFWLLFIWKFVGARADRLLYTCLAVDWTFAIGSSLVNLVLIPEAVTFWHSAAVELFFTIAIFVRLYALARDGNRDAQRSSFLSVSRRQRAAAFRSSTH